MCNGGGGRRRRGDAVLLTVDLRVVQSAWVLWLLSSPSTHGVPHPACIHHLRWCSATWYSHIHFILQCKMMFLNNCQVMNKPPPFYISNEWIVQIQMNTIYSFIWFWVHQSNKECNTHFRAMDDKSIVLVISKNIRRSFKKCLWYK